MATNGQRPDLTPRKIEILQLLANGLTQREAAIALGLSYHTIKAHLKQMYSRNGWQCEMDAVVAAMRAGIIE